MVGSQRISLGPSIHEKIVWLQVKLYVIAHPLLITTHSGLLLFYVNYGSTQIKSYHRRTRIKLLSEGDYRYQTTDKKSRYKQIETVSPNLRNVRCHSLGYSPNYNSASEHCE